MVSQTCVAKTIQGNNTQQVKMGGAFRLIMYGGARKSSDNNAFYFAAQNVQKDYRNDMCIYSVLISNGAKQIVEYLKNQTDNTVQSLDIFCHGGTSGLYMRMNSSLSENSDDAKTSNLYQSVLAMNLGYAGLGFWSGDYKDQLTLGDLKLSVFTNACKIEIHGCSTAEDDDNFCEEFSRLLYRAGKLKSVVIGHKDKANPNINGANTTNQQQDYRHGTRVIYHNGIAKKIVNKKGRIGADEINQIFKS